MEQVLSTTTGIILFKEGDKFYSTNPKEIIQALWTDINNRPNDPFGALMAAELLEEIQAKGGIKSLGKSFHFFTSDAPDEEVITTIFAEPERAKRIIQMKFQIWGYKGNPKEI